MNKALLFCFLLIFVGSALSAPICVNDTPDMLAPHGPAVCQSISGLGDTIVLPEKANFIAEVWWEDLDARSVGTCESSGLPGDCDYNDAKVIVTGDWITKELRLFWVGNPLLAAYTNQISPVGHSEQWVNRNSTDGVLLSVNWVPGEELVLQNRVFWDGDPNVNSLWYTGSGDRNADGLRHAIVKMSVTPLTIDCPVDPPVDPEPIPEPSTIIMSLLGLASIVTGKFVRRNK